MDHQGLRFIVADGRVETLGLESINRRDLAMRATTKVEIEKAKCVLFDLAAYIVSTTAHLRPGDEVVVGDDTVAITSGGGYIMEVLLAGVDRHEC